MHGLETYALVHGYRALVCCRCWRYLLGLEKVSMTVDYEYTSEPVISLCCMCLNYSLIPTAYWTVCFLNEREEWEVTKEFSPRQLDNEKCEECTPWHSAKHFRSSEFDMHIQPGGIVQHC